MRTRGLLIFFYLPLLLSSAAGYRRDKRHRAPRKRMARPQNLFEDFAPLSIDAGGGYGYNHRGDAGLAGGETAGSEAAGGAAGGSTGGATGGVAGGAANNCQEPSAQCNVKEIFKPGNPKEKSFSIAFQAAQDAKAANEAQAAAGLAAAQHIKLELAEKAFQSAKAAEAALMGKQMMVEQLEQEVSQANAVIEEETNSLHSTEINMKAAMDASRLATEQLHSFTELQKTFKENLANIQTVAMGVQQEMASKTQLVEAAQSRIAMLRQQLQISKEDYEKTKQAAYKAACAAIEAKQKAASNNDGISAVRKRRQPPHCPLSIDDNGVEGESKA
ncbi:uncharacterized protein [Drosophila pseudoobscura]|uniref:Glycine, alanine and asparagine-rich protein n=1 Tax=Drosophila pseudoobscura pseudoobscura TaxID=46245 RepID=A0A6I8V727_DROPS|nr:uncharacterized protein LOC26533905 [Drosophila pseudoobscura]